MSPFRNTMSFINGIEGNLDGLQEIHIILFCQRLRSYIEEFGLSRQDIFLHLFYCRFVEGRVQIMCHTIIFTETIDDIYLIFHQCYQWRNDNGRSLHDEGRQLITQTLSTSSRHKHKCIMTTHQISDDSFLLAFKLIKTEIALKLTCKINLFCHIQLIN